jgi:hypothetical protein
MPVLIYLQIIATLLSSTVDKKSYNQTLPIILFLTMGILTSWFLAAAVALLVSVCLVSRHLRSGRPKIFIGLVVANFAVLVLILIMLFSAGTISSPAGALTLDGGYPILPRVFVLFIVLLAAGFIYKNRPSLRKLVNLESFYGSVGIIFGLLLLSYFLLTSGTLSYYFLKIETSITVVLLPLGVVFLLEVFSRYRFVWQYSVLLILTGFYISAQLISPNDYFQYITDWNNKAATLEVNAAAPIVQKLSRPIYDPAQNTCTIIINKVYIESINADHIANNTTNRLVENHCLPDDYLSLHNSGQLDFQIFVKLANRHNVKYELFTSQQGGGPEIINFDTNESAVEVLSY